jgi:hypothetical protein
VGSTLETQTNFPLVVVGALGDALRGDADVADVGGGALIHQPINRMTDEARHDDCSTGVA